MRVVTENGHILRIDAPEWFAMDAFRAAVDRNTSAAAANPLATFHRHGSAFTESSDIFILFDAHEALNPDGESEWSIEFSDLLDEPGLEQVYDSIARLTHELELSHGILWLSNVGLPT
jgi:hypothetical protein